jgi:hypothetical protein
MTVSRVQAERHALSGGAQPSGGIAGAAEDRQRTAYGLPSAHMLFSAGHDAEQPVRALGGGA